ncbi:MAG: HAD family hydrolase [Solirubrobacteraceae bacterium]
MRGHLLGRRPGRCRDHRGERQLTAASGDGDRRSPATADGQASLAGAVFFDLDRTLMQGSSAFQFGRAAYQAGMLSRRQLASDAWANVRFRLRGSTDEGTQALRDRISHSLAGTRVVDMDRLGAPVLARVLPRVYPRMLELAHEHQDAGRRAYIVTAASKELAEILAHVLALDGGIGSQFSEVRDGVYTGHPAGLFIYGQEKALAIERLAGKEGIDLAESYAYSDSSSDLPMLRAVGHPVAVNPDRELLAAARQEGWEVLRFDRLGRRLETAAGVGATALAGGLITAALIARARRHRFRRVARRLRLARWAARVALRHAKKD